MTENRPKSGVEDLVRCSRCLLPETHETITFDANGVCNVCLNQDVKRSIDWDSKRIEFEGIVEEYRVRLCKDQEGNCARESDFGEGEQVFSVDTSFFE